MSSAFHPIRIYGQHDMHFMHDDLELVMLRGCAFARMVAGTVYYLCFT